MTVALSVLQQLGLIYTGKCKSQLCNTIYAKRKQRAFEIIIVLNAGCLWMLTYGGDCILKLIFLFFLEILDEHQKTNSSSASVVC